MEQRQRTWLGRVIVGLTALMLAILVILIASPANTNFEKTGKEIYAEADYLTRIEMIYENPRTGALSTNYGAGFLVNFNDKYRIVTVAHLLSPRYKLKQATARFKGQPGVYFISFDNRHPDLDLVTFKIDDPDFFFLGRLAKLNLDSYLSVGDRVYSLGSPLETDFCLGEGIARNLNTVTKEWGRVITTNADVGLAPGSSGGPLLNVYGEIIGMGVGMRVEDAGNGHIFYPAFGYALYMEDILKWLASIY